MNKHTPGPWKAIRFSGKWLVYAGENIKHDSCSVSGFDACVSEIDPHDEMKSSEARANSKLVAAAPELLEALQLVRDYLVTMKGNGHEYQIAIDSAIAKALNKPITE